MNRRRKIPQTPCNAGRLGRAHRSYRWGVGAGRAQWAMQRSGGVLSKGASQAAAPRGDHCEVDRATGAAPDLSDQPSAARRSRTGKPEGLVALRDHRFESCCDWHPPEARSFRGFLHALPGRKPPLCECSPCCYSDTKCHMDSPDQVW